MGEKDIAEKNLEAWNDVFADGNNYRFYVFEGGFGAGKGVDAPAEPHGVIIQLNKAETSVIEDAGERE